MKSNFKIEKNHYKYILSFLWSLFEATFFFIVADVPLSFISIYSLKEGFKTLFFVLLGAIIGGAIMYYLGYNNPSFITDIEILPDVNSKFVLEVNNSLKNNGLFAMFNGPVKGIPYKIYASYSGAMKLNVFMFILLSIPARAIRFIITILTANFVSKVLLKKASLTTKKLILLIFWVLSLAFYFSKL